MMRTSPANLTPALALPARWPSVAPAAAWAHRHFLWLLVAGYAVAALLPGPGEAIKHSGLGSVALGGETLSLSTPVLLLAFLLFNAGLGVRGDRLARLARAPGLLVAGLAANTLVPLAFIGLAAALLQFWPSESERQAVILGLALIVSMPIAGSSTAWSQRAGGDLALSLGLVLVSTLLSPLATPAVLGVIAPLTQGEYATALQSLAGKGTGLFLGVGVLVPSLLGLATGALVGQDRLSPWRDGLKLASTACLLVLIYANAAGSLSDAVAHPDWDFWAIVTAAVVALSAVSFTAGHLVAKLTGADAGGRAALMFGLGMNNNGTGLVLASTTLAAFPRVMLPVIAYNLVQHLAAGLVERWWPDGRAGR